MANKYPRLTWLEKSNRWRKRHKDKDYYFPVREGETKPQSYRRCLQEWQQKKAELERQDYHDSPDHQAYKEGL